MKEERNETASEKKVMEHYVTHYSQVEWFVCRMYYIRCFLVNIHRVLMYLHTCACSVPLPPRGSHISCEDHIISKFKQYGECQ